MYIVFFCVHTINKLAGTFVGLNCITRLMCHKGSGLPDFGITRCYITIERTKSVH